MKYEYNTVYRDQALKVYESLITRNLIDSEAIKFEQFYVGFRAALDNINEQKTLKQNEKSGVFNIYDFLDCEIVKAGVKGSRYFLSGVYNDAENKKLVVTNAQFLIYSDCEVFEDCFKNQIVSKDKTIIEGRFPDYKKVIPEILQAANTSILDDLKIASSQLNYKTQQQAKKANLVMRPLFIDDLLITPYMLFMVVKFIKTQKNIRLECQEDKSKSWVITGDTATMVFMPGRNLSDNELNDKEYASAYFENGSLIFNKIEE